MTRTGKDTQEPRPYLSYLLRLWQFGSAGGKVWRASLESVQSGERLAFASLRALFEYLQAETGVEAAEDQLADQPQSAALATTEDKVEAFGSEMNRIKGGG